MAVSPASQPSSTPSLADQAYAILRDRLVMLEIAPGEPMNEQLLAAELGMGRTPIRESLKKLETEHLVDSYPRQGTFASRIDIGDLAAISEIRVILEPQAAYKAALEASPEQRESLNLLARGLESSATKPARSNDLLAYDLSVHRAIYSAVENTYFRETLERLDNLATRIWISVLDRLPDVARHVEDHVALLDAIVAGESQKAYDLAREHILSFEQSVRATL